MSETIISTEKYKKQNIEDFKNKVNINKIQENQLSYLLKI